MYKIITPSTSFIDLFFYELTMFNGVYKLLMNEERKTEAGRNALLESFLLHARNLIDFLSNNRNKPDDLTCSDFKDKDGNIFSAIPIAIPTELKFKINKHVSHLTKKRMEEKLGWDTHSIKAAINNSSKIFIIKCSSGHFGSPEIQKEVEEKIASGLIFS